MTTRQRVQVVHLSTGGKVEEQDVHPSQPPPPPPRAESPTNAPVTSTNWHEEIDSLDDMGLKPELLRGIYAIGFEKPSAIQQRAITPVVKGKDTIAQAQSGTGKTGTFSIGILQSIDEKRRECQALVLAPTRELAQQIQRVMHALATYMKVVVHACVGGTAVRDDIAKLRDGVHVVVGTPGRVFDMINRKVLSLRDLKLFVLDEADEMLNRGFKDKIYDIFACGMPRDVQVGLFSATMPAAALDITAKFMRDPAVILLKNEELTLQGIKQFFVAVEREEWKLDTLCDLYEALTIAQAIIYCNSRHKVDWLTEKLRSRDYTVAAMHGDMDMRERQQVMKDFRSGASRVLISTDLLARGIDVHAVSLVINYDLPSNRENYIHRIGRSGRYGRKGVAINFVTAGDVPYMKDIEQFYNTQISELPVDVGSIM